MKSRLLILAFIAISCQAIYSQNIKIETVKSKEISTFANRISFFKYVILNDDLSATVFFLCNPPGSGKREGTGQISHDIGLLVSESGDFPEYHFYEIKDLFHPELVEQSPDDIKEKTIRFSYLDSLDIKRVIKVKVSLKGIQLVR